MKSKLFGILYPVVLVAFTAFVLADFFLIERVYTVVDGESEINASNISEYDDDIDSYNSQPIGGNSNESHTGISSVQDESSYIDENIRIELTEHRVGDTTVYVADVNIKDASLLKTAFAKNAYGKNIKQKTSVIAESKNALLAINGDYYSARQGCVIRNGELYRNFSDDSNQEALIIKSDGSFDFVYESEGNEEKLIEENVLQVLSFGPVLIKEGEINVEANDEVDKAMRNNPRTAIAWFGGTHYAFVVGDGRTDESKGLSLYELAEFLQELGVKAAYNLDGGGSSTLYYNGEVVNKPTTNGRTISEREVSDIVYVGY